MGSIHPPNKREASNSTRKLLLILLALCLAAIFPRWWVPTSASISAQPEGRPFPETSHTVKGRFLQYWQEHGGLAQQGYPISDEMQERSDTDGKTYTVQYFERAVFELHPENVPPYDVLLSLLGNFEYSRKYGSAGAPGQRTSDTNPMLFRETGKSVGGTFRRYWEMHGGLAQQGYPISEEFQERSDLDGKTYTMQYFERAVFEYHPENAGTPYEVLLSQLGKFQYDRRYAAGQPAGSPTPAEAAVPVEVTSWLREHAIPLGTTDVSDDFSDLMPLKAIIGDARIVSLGEAAHGGREFFTMKHRILRFLVEEMGFTVLAMEDGWAEGVKVNEYVEGGRGTADSALRNFLYWPWQATEVLDLLTWMREYNASRGGAPALSFHAFDMQVPTLPMENVVAYLEGVDPQAAERARGRYECFEDYQRYRGLPQQAKVECRAGLQAVYDEITSKREAYVVASSQEAFIHAQFSARVVLQAEDLMSGPDRFDVRDRYMAENLASILEQRGANARVVVWAHNGHVMTTQSYAGHTYPSMGAHLRERYGDAMRVIGFDFNRGSFNAYGPASGRPQVHTIPAAPDGSYGHYFASAGMPVFLLDLGGIRPGASETGWLLGPRRMLNVGSLYAGDLDAIAPEVSLPAVFDAIIHITGITPTTLRPTTR